MRLALAFDHDGGLIVARGERVPHRGYALQGVTLLASRWRHDGGARRGLDRIVDQRPDHGWLDAPALVGDGNRIGFDHDLDDWRDRGFFRLVERVVGKLLDDRQQIRTGG